MKTVVPIVEGDGEVQALPVLLRRLSQWLSPDRVVDLGRPIRVRRERFLRNDAEFRRMLLLAAAKVGGEGWVLVLLDADDDCPAELASEIAIRARTVIPHCEVSVVCANREFEAWFLASAESLSGKRGLFVADGDSPQDPDSIRGAKEWLSRRIVEGRYRETTDQPAFAAVMDLELARGRSRSFRKMCAEWARLAIVD